jgi:hypothetical protein
LLVDLMEHFGSTVQYHIKNPKFLKIKQCSLVNSKYWKVKIKKVKSTNVFNGFFIFTFGLGVSKRY